MNTTGITATIANSTVHFSDRSRGVSLVEWKEHPTFKGVYLKHVITGADTGGLFSSHLVSIDPGQCLETHCHENQMELHEVIEGAGYCHLVEDRFDYHPGKMAVIRKGEKHLVWAGENGLTLLAKFFPALV